MIIYIVGIIIFTLISAFWSDFRKSAAESSHSRARLNKTEKIIFTSSKDLLKYIDNIHSYADELSNEFDKLDEDKLTSHQFEKLYDELVHTSYQNMFHKFPHLLTIEEDKIFNESRCYGRDATEKFEAEKFESLTFFKNLVCVDFNVKVKEVDTSVECLSGRKNITYHCNPPTGTTYDSINKGDTINMKGYVEDVNDWTILRDYQGIVIGVVCI